MKKLFSLLFLISITLFITSFTTEVKTEVTPSASIELVAPSFTAGLDLITAEVGTSYNVMIPRCTWRRDCCWGEWHCGWVDWFQCVTQNPGSTCRMCGNTWCKVEIMYVCQL